jgi:glycosyltransferase involved in cell wall biosynthesis
VQGYYAERFHTEPPYIPYGSDIKIVPPGDTLKKYGLEEQGYILFVGRLVPENCVHHLIEAYIQLNTELKCVIVGDSSYAEPYKNHLKSLARDNPNIIFTGYIFGDGYHELGSNATLFVETSEVGGTHPAVIEAMAFGNCVIVNDTPENLETIADAGLSYDGKIGSVSLRDILNKLLSKPSSIKTYQNKATNRARNTYSWEAVTDAYENLFYEILEGT